MTSLPASILGLDRPTEGGPPPRGTIRAGWAADLVLFDPAEVRDQASYDAPHTLAEGMRAVWVNGALSWMDGSGGAEGRNGRVLRRR